MRPRSFFHRRILQRLGADGFAFVSKELHARNSLVEKHNPAAPGSGSVRGNARHLTGDGRMISVSCQARMVLDLGNVNPSADRKWLTTGEGVHVRQLQPSFPIELHSSV